MPECWNSLCFMCWGELVSANFLCLYRARSAEHRFLFFFFFFFLTFFFFFFLTVIMPISLKLLCCYLMNRLEL